MENETQNSNRILNSDKELAEIQGRKNFYNRREVGKFLLAHGVPRTKQQTLSLIALDTSEATDGSIPRDHSYLGKVSFEIHPQQINIRDKVNGELINSIAR
jgi:hypothetical protein